MSTNSPSAKMPAIIKYAAALLFLVLVIYSLQALQSIVVPIIFSILIAISLFPLAIFFEKRLRFGKALAAIISVILAILLISGVIWFIVHQTIAISRDAENIQYKIMIGVEQVRTWIETRFGFGRTELNDKIQEQTNKIIGQAGSYMTTFMGSLGNTLTGIIMVPLYSFFLLYYRDFFKEFFFRAFKNSSNEKINTALNKIYVVVQSYLVGLATVMFIVAILNTIGLYFMGIEYAWFFGTLASLLMLLPYIGIAIGSILPAVFALATKDQAWYALGVIIWFQVVQFLEANIITPNITGSKVSINPLMAIIAIIMGGMLFGLTGLIIALPFLATLKVVLDAHPDTEAFGFVIGEPEKAHLKNKDRTTLLERWGIIPRTKPKNTSETQTTTEEEIQEYYSQTATIDEEVNHHVQPNNDDDTK